MNSRILKFLVLILLFSCNQGDPNRLIPRKDLVPLLAELHITDAIATSGTISDQFGRLDSTILYSKVMERYGYSKDDLFFTLDYYTGEPEILMEIYDEVFALLSTGSEEAKAAYNKYASQNTQHIWRPKENRFEIESDTALYPVFDDILIDSTGTYVLNLSMKLRKEDESENPVLIAYFYSPNRDSLGYRQYFDTVKLHKSKYARELMLIKDISDTSLTRLRIHSVVFDNKDSAFFKSMDMYSVRLSLLKSKAEIGPKRKP